MGRTVVEVPVSAVEYTWRHSETAQRPLRALNAVGVGLARRRSGAPGVHLVLGDEAAAKIGQVRRLRERLASANPSPSFWIPPVRRKPS